MKSKKIMCVSLCAALLLSGCANSGNTAPEVSESETTTSAAETTTTTAAETTTAGPQAAALDGEEDAKPSQLSDDNGLVKNISTLPYNKFINKPIEVENRERLNMEDEDWSFRAGEAPNDDGYVYLGGEGRGNRFRAKARISSGAMSAECDDGFREKVASSAEAFPYGTDTTGVFEMLPTTIHVTGADNDHVYADEVKYGYKTACYDDIVVVNAFVRRAKETTLKYYADNEYYEVIIDPAFMSGLRLPMTEYDPERMKFTVNGKDFYADTMHGYPIRVSYIDNEPLFGDYQSGDFIYAKVALMNLTFTCDNINGGVFDGNIMSIEKITDDTAAIIDGETAMPEEHEGIAAAMAAARDEMITANTISFELVDLDFDGTPEVLAVDGEPQHMEGPDATATLRVFRYNGSAMEKIGETEFGDYGELWLDECVYIPKNEHGWHLMNVKEHDFLTIKNGKLDILRLNYWSEAVTSGDNTEYKWYYLDEEIKVEPYEAYNPLKGKTETYYKWVSDNSRGYSVMGDNFYSVNYMLYENLNDDFSKIRRLTLDPKADIWQGEISWEENRFSNYFTPSATFPYDLLNVFYTGAEDAEYEKFLGLSFEGAKEKPVIYLYPEEQTDVSVQVNFPFGGELTCTYPDYGDGWNVTAMPDGTLYDSNGDEYYCLYWEGQSRDIMTSSEGFCVAGSDTAQFLREKLMYIGLTAREANEFIIYWLPKMHDNPYNVITLHTDDYARSVPLSVSPAPDTQIRVFMTYRSSDTPVDIPEQELPHFERTGFTLVEWGGSEEN